MGGCSRSQAPWSVASNRSREGLQARRAPLASCRVRPAPRVRGAHCLLSATCRSSLGLLPVVTLGRLIRRPCLLRVLRLPDCRGVLAPGSDPGGVLPVPAAARRQAGAALAAVVIVGGSLLRDRRWTESRVGASRRSCGDAPGNGVRAVVRDGDLGVFRPTWSLTVEWCFYLAFPGFCQCSDGAGRPGTVARILWWIAGGLYAFGLLLPARVSAFFPWRISGCSSPAPHWPPGTGASCGFAAADPGRVDVGSPPPSDRRRTGSQIGWGWQILAFPLAVVAALVVLHGCRSENLVSRSLSWRPLRARPARTTSVCGTCPCCGSSARTARDFRRRSRRCCPGWCWHPSSS